MDIGAAVAPVYVSKPPVNMSVRIEGEYVLHVGIIWKSDVSTAG